MLPEAADRPIEDLGIAIDRVDRKVEKASELLEKLISTMTNISTEGAWAGNSEVPMTIEEAFQKFKSEIVNDLSINIFKITIDLLKYIDGQGKPKESSYNDKFIFALIEHFMPTNLDRHFEKHESDYEEIQTLITSITKKYKKD